MMIPVEQVHEYIEGIGYDALIETILMLIGALVCLASFKVYRIVRDKDIKMLTLGFFLLTIAYFSVAAGNLTLYIQKTIFVRPEFFFIIHFAYLFAKTLGLLTLAAIPLKINDWKVYGLFAVLIFCMTYASTHHIFLYQVVCLLLYAIIVWAYSRNFILRRNKKTLLLALGFGFLALASITFMFLEKGFLFYILGHIIEFLGYVFILLALLLAYTFKNEKRKTTNNS